MCVTATYRFSLKKGNISLGVKRQSYVPLSPLVFRFSWSIPFFLSFGFHEAFLSSVFQSSSRLQLFLSFIFRYIYESSCFSVFVTRATVLVLQCTWHDCSCLSVFVTLTTVHVLQCTWHDCSCLSVFVTLTTVLVLQCTWHDCSCLSVFVTLTTVHVFQCSSSKPRLRVGSRECHTKKPEWVLKPDCTTVVTTVCCIIVASGLVSVLKSVSSDWLWPSDDWLILVELGLRLWRATLWCYYNVVILSKACTCLMTPVGKC